jgi:hypothetical protein
MAAYSNNSEFGTITGVYCSKWITEHGFSCSSGFVSLDNGDWLPLDIESCRQRRIKSIALTKDQVRDLDFLGCEGEKIMAVFAEPYEWPSSIAFLLSNSKVFCTATTPASVFASIVDFDEYLKRDGLIDFWTHEPINSET